MKPTTLIHNRRRQQTAPSISLFPFLAVLMCTMGTLILLLVVLTRQARVQAAEAATRKAAQQQDDLKVEIEAIRWRIEQLQQSRGKTEADLAGARMELGHVEEHSQRLRDQVAQLQAAHDQLERLGTDGKRRLGEIEADLTRIAAEVDAAQQRLAEAEEAAAQRRRGYCVVPYRGPHGTHRRPMYIECRDDAVVLQPEGIVLKPADFEGPMGPGNPLAAALRAEREYLAAQGSPNPEKEDLYPLMLVRPDGIVAYYAARLAMESWAAEFGYELIGADWKLDFPPPDPQLAEAVRRAVDTARVRQEQLIAAAPRQYGTTRRAEYTVAPGRGIVRYSAPRDEDDPFGFRHRRPAGAFGSRFAPTGDSDADERQVSANNGQTTATGPDGATANPEASPSDEAHVAVRTGAASSPAGQPETGAGAARPGKTAASGPPREATEATAEHGGTPLRPGEWRPSDGTAGARPGAKPAAHAKPRTKSMAHSRGRDWGLPDAAHGSVPITRPIRVQCHADRLVVMPEAGVAAGKAIPLGPRTETAVDTFVSAVWEHMGSWGMAGNGMFWRPVLKIEVAPDAEQRFADLSELLEQSGLAVERKN